MNWLIEYMNTSTQEVNGFTEVVLNCGWRCNGEQDSFTATAYGTCSFVPPPEGDPNFIPYADLTQQQVLDWCWAAGVDKDATELAVQNQLNQQINPAEQQLPLPWQS